MTTAKPDLFNKVVPVTNPRHRDQLMTLAGMQECIATLEEAKSALPGMVMAIALVKGLAAKEQVTLSGMVYREAAKAGADLSAVSAIYTRHDEKGDLVMIVESETPAT